MKTYSNKYLNTNKYLNKIDFIILKYTWQKEIVVRSKACISNNVTFITCSNKAALLNANNNSQNIIQSM